MREPKNAALIPSGVLLACLRQPGKTSKAVDREGHCSVGCNPLLSIKVMDERADSKERIDILGTEAKGGGDNLRAVPSVLVRVSAGKE
jgi:hypothetical protein